MVLRSLLGIIIVVVTSAVLSIEGCNAGSTSSNASAEAAPADNPKCVWDESFQRQALDAGLEMVGPPPHIRTGDNFQSVNACNGCGCTEGGLECTHNACPHSTLDDYPCPADTFQCLDGPLMRRFGPNCLFPTCDAARGHSCLGFLRVCDAGDGEGGPILAASGGPFCTQTCP